MQRVLFSVALLLCLLLASLGLGGQVLNEDEANTALFARNLLRFGERAAWDGRNLIGYEFGAELDDRLFNYKMPPQQFYLAAAGMTVFGDSAPGVRVIFVLIGVAGVAFAGWWARFYFGSRFAYAIVAFLLALSPAYLLYIRCARYFAPAFAWAMILFLLWTLASRGAGRRRRSRRGWLLLGGGGAVAVFGLFTANDLIAVATLAVLPVFLLDRRYRTRSQLCYLGLIYAAAIPIGVWSLVRLDVFGELAARQDAESVSRIRATTILLWRHLRDFGTFEYFSWLMVLPLALPWLVSKLRPQRRLALSALILVIAVLAYVVVLSVVSPTWVHVTWAADMRYAIPLIGVGALITAAALAILWRVTPGLAIVVGVALIGSNLLYPGQRSNQYRYLVNQESTLRSTLWDYLYETRHPVPAVYHALTNWLRQVPEGTEVRLMPYHVTYSSMYDLPALRYCAQFSEDRPLQPELAGVLPRYVYRERCQPQVVLIHPIAAQGMDLGDSLTSVVDGTRLHYRLRGVIPTHWPNGIGPDIPVRHFRPPPMSEGVPGFYIYELVRIEPLSAR